MFLTVFYIKSINLKHHIYIYKMCKNDTTNSFDNNIYKISNHLYLLQYENIGINEYVEV